MQAGDIIIHKDVLGIVTNIYNNGTCRVCNKDDKAFTFQRSECTPVISAWSLARLYYDKLAGLQQ